MAISWSDSADRHGIPREDALYAMSNAYFRRAEFDEPRKPGASHPTLYIGPPRQLGGPLLEVMAEIVAPRGMHVFHVMPARAKFLAMMEEEQESENR